ncbi:hypothetical protein XaC1_39 [Xanthomonas phage XaC1]|nr:hypothetical protein XaC1_39 [Xanthomonas phage XaC1]
MNATNTTTNHSRLTLVSTLEQGKPSIVAEVLYKQGRTVAEVKQFDKTLRKAVKLAKSLFREDEKRRKEQEKERIAAEKAKQQQEQLLQKNASQAIEAAKNVLLETLIAGGMSEKQAKEVVAQEFSHVYPMGKVQVSFRGKTFTTSLRGKASDDLKEALKATNMSRKSFIEHFQVHA